jgi:hypothetical protein
MDFDFRQVIHGNLGCATCMVGDEDAGSRWH